LRSADIYQIFSKGGRPLLDFLDYCIRSIEVDALFIFLVSEYRNGATRSKAVALYDLFCAPDAPARVSATKALPPYDFRLRETIRPLKAADIAAGALPPRYLFDFLVFELQKTARMSTKLRRYKPSRSPIENLPGRRMSQVQLHFVQNVWQPIIRPKLVAAGFWRIGTIA
jgi:hypothetical protein